MRRRLLTLFMATALCVSAMTGCSSDQTENVTTESEASSDQEAGESTSESSETTVSSESSETSVSSESAEPSDEGENPEDTSGTIDGTSYSNEFYNFRITVPDGWAILNHEDTLNIMYQSMATIYEDAQELQEQLEAAGTDYLFYAYSETPDSLGNMANAIAQSLPVSQMGALTLEEMVDATLASTVAQYAELGGSTEVTDASAKDVNGHELVCADSVTVITVTNQDGSQSELTVSQKYAAFTTDTHIVMMVVSYYTDAEAQDAQDTIDSIEFLN